jgi:hypothetical protein
MRIEIRFRVVVTRAAVGLVAGLGAVASVAAEPATAFVEGRAAGDGGWKRDGTASRSTSHLSVDLVRDGNRISGSVDLTGSPLADRGVVSGAVRGDRVRGSIVSPEGEPIASFSGTIAADGMAGTYRDRTGEQGTWSWSAP